jgi:hypothetical protein
MEPNLNFTNLSKYCDDIKIVKLVALQIEKNQHQNFKKLVDDIYTYIERPNQETKFSIEYCAFPFAHAKAIQKPTTRDLQILCGYKFDKGSYFSTLPSEILHFILRINPLMHFDTFETILRDSYFKVKAEKVHTTKRFLIKMASTKGLTRAVAEQTVEKEKSCCFCTIF